jgi:hypothetical protein
MITLKYELDKIGSILLISIIILSSVMIIESNIDIAYSQTKSLVTSFEVNDSVYTANSSSIQGNQIIENGTTSKTYDTTTASATLNSSSHNPTYSVTNASIAVRTDTLDGANSNKPIFVNQTQTIILPQEDVLIGKK